MGKMNGRSKQGDFIRIGGMFFFVFVLVLSVSTKSKASERSDCGDVYTSTESVLNKSYDELVDSLDAEVFGEYLSTLESGNSYIIPGIDKTNICNEQICSSMIPQGICVTEEYLIISAYDKSHKIARDFEYRSECKQKSVLYIMDVTSRQYLTTITLDTTCHVGALAYNPDDKLIYVADSSNGVVQKLSMSKIHACVVSGNDAGVDVVTFDEGEIDTQGYRPSFLAYYQDYLYVGQFAKSKQNRNEMAVFRRDGTLVEQASFQIPHYAQGVAFANWQDKTYMLLSSSYGRNKPAKLHVYLMDQKADGFFQMNCQVGAFACPNMSEDIDVKGDCIYTCYESASNFYRLALDDKGTSSNVVDRIMVSSLKKTIGTITKGDANWYMHKFLTMSTQYGKRNLVCMDIDDRRRLFLRLS